MLRNKCILTVPKAPFPSTLPFFHCMVSSKAEDVLSVVQALSALSPSYISSESVESAFMALASSSRCWLGKLSSRSISTKGLLLISAARFCNSSSYDETHVKVLITCESQGLISLLTHTPLVIVNLTSIHQ